MNRLRQLFVRRRHTDDLWLEIQAHLDEKIDALMAEGMTRREATAAAHRAFGNVPRVEERSRDVWAWPTLDSFTQDVRFAFRQVRRRPALAMAAILTLAIGVAANTTVFSWTRAVLLDPLPGAANEGRIVAIEELTPSDESTLTSFLDFRDIRDYTHSFTSMTLMHATTFVVGDDASAERRFGEAVSATFFDALGVKASAGRLFSAAEGDEVPGAHPVVVLGHDLWLSRYGGDRSVLGSTILINRSPFTVIGVAPADFHGSLPGMDAQLWVPVSMLGNLDPNGTMFLRDRKTRLFRVLAQLAPGVTIDQARAELRAFAKRMSVANADTNEGMSATVLPVWRSHYGLNEFLRAPLAILMAASGLMLLIVCANLANLLLTRAAGRRKELSLRLALGAPRRRIVRQLLTEAAVLTAAGSALGLLATAWLSGALRLFVPSFAAPNILRPHVDGGVLLFTLLLACGVTLLAGMVPALHGAREHLSEAMNDAGRGTTRSLRGNRLRSALVAGEVAVALVTLVGAGLFLKSFHELRRVSPGFDAHGVAMGRVSLSTAGFDAAHGDAFLRAVQERLEGEPGVTDVSYADYVPLSLETGSWEDLQVEGYTPGPSENMKLYRAAVAPGYFGLMRIDLTEGRDFSANDDADHDPVMIVNEAFVRHFFDGRPALGQRVHGWGRWFTIVGVVRDSKIYRLSEAPTPYFYVPIRQVYRPEFPFTFFVRTRGAVDAAAAAIRRDVRDADPAVPTFNVMTLDEYITAPLDQVKTATTLLGIIAAIAFLLAAIGLYGVMAHAVAGRVKEIGIRLAMGARRGELARMIARQAGLLVALGLVVGVGGAAVLARLVAAMLYGVGPDDLVVYAGASLCMVLIATVATGIPVRRAMRVDPAVALRDE
jgi:predicted permease